MGPTSRVVGAIVCFLCTGAIPALAIGDEGISLPPATNSTAPQPGATNQNPFPLGPPANSEVSPEDAQVQTPEAVAARAHSQDAYEDLGVGQANALLQQRFSEEIGQLDDAPGRSIEPSSVEKFLGEDAARIDPPGPDDSQVVVSSFPLRDVNDSGQVKPVNLDLVEEGGHFEPGNALADVAFPDDLGGALRLQGAEIEIGFDSEEASSSEAVRVNDDQLFFHEAAPDTDVLMTPLASGAEVFAQIRSAASPERLKFELDLPPGADLRGAGPDSLEIVGPDGPVARIHTPWAVDAQGTPVEISLAATTQGFDMTVKHQAADVAYPILADPVIDYLTENWYGGNSWFYGNQNGLGYSAWSTTGGYFPAATLGVVAGWGYGLYLRAPAGWYYPNGAFAHWAYQAPGQTTYITRADFGPVNYWKGGEAAWVTPHSYWGLWSSGYNWVNGVNTRGASFNYEYTTKYAGPGTATHAIFGMASSYSRATTVNREADLGGIQIYLDEPDADLPKITGFTSQEIPTGWLKSGPVVARAKAEDLGLGLTKFHLRVPRPAGQADALIVPPNWAACGGTRSTTICPQRVAGPDGVSPIAFTANTENMPEGVNSLKFEAEDALQKTAIPQTFDVKVDRTAPTLTVDEQFDSSMTQYTVMASASDASSAAQVSGIQKVQVSLDGQPQLATPLTSGAQTWSGGTCSANCASSASTTWTHEFPTIPDGGHRIQISVVDGAGNVSPVKDYYVDAVPIVHAKLYDNDPSQGGQQVAEEWAQLSTRNSRREESSGISTRGLISCPSNAAEQCVSHRRIQTPEGAGSPGPDDYSELNTPAEEDNGDQAATLLVDDDLDPSAQSGSGSISNVVQSWQVLPPEAGSTYEMYEVSHPATEFELSKTIKYWIDATTRLPLKVAVSSGGNTETLYYSYQAQELHAAALPANFFRLAQPQADSCLESGTVAGMQFNAAGMVPEVSSPAGSTATVYTSGGDIVLRPVGEAAEDGDPRSTLEADGVSLSPDPEDEGELHWRVSLAADQELVSQADGDVTIATEDGQPTAEITSTEGPVEVDPGEPAQSGQPATDDQIVLSADDPSASLAIESLPTDNPQNQAPCITEELIDQADSIVGTYLSSPSAPLTTFAAEDEFEEYALGNPDATCAAAGKVPKPSQLSISGPWKMRSRQRWECNETATVVLWHFKAYLQRNKPKNDARVFWDRDLVNETGARVPYPQYVRYLASQCQGFSRFFLWRWKGTFTPTYEVQTSRGPILIAVPATKTSGLYGYFCH